jgi:hypothetical protein
MSPPDTLVSERDMADSEADGGLPPYPSYELSISMRGPFYRKATFQASSRRVRRIETPERQRLSYLYFRNGIQERSRAGDTAAICGTNSAAGCCPVSNAAANLATAGAVWIP